MNFTAPCIFGLESLVSDELKKMGAENVAAENGRVFFSGDEYLAARANIRSRFSERIMIVVGSFEAHSFEELFEGTKALPWENFIGEFDEFPVKGHSVNSDLFSISDCQSIIKKAIVERLKTKYNVQWFEETGVKFQIDFSIMKNMNRGEIFGFLGANGAGKTTAMRMLCGLSKPTSGIGKVAGYDIFREAEQVKKHIGYMSQKFSLYEDLKVWENIRLFAGIYGMKEQEIERKTEELLDRLELTAERDTLVKSLPVGWKQKLAFSVSIFHEPRIVFLDEPTGGVDPATRRQFWELIYQAADQGITIFVTTHYMDEAEYCNRISIMVDGQIKALDTPARLKQQFGAETMDDVFQQLARGAVRKAD